MKSELVTSMAKLWLIWRHPHLSEQCAILLFKILVTFATDNMSSYTELLTTINLQLVHFDIILHQTMYSKSRHNPLVINKSQ